MPRRRPLNREALAMVLGALRAGATMEQAAAIVGVSYQALYKRMHRYPSFRAQVEEARDYADGAVQVAFFKEAKKGSYQHGAFWLSRRMRQDWGDEPKASAALEAIIERLANAIELLGQDNPAVRELVEVQLRVALGDPRFSGRYVRERLRATHDLLDRLLGKPRESEERGGRPPSGEPGPVHFIEIEGYQPDVPS